MKGLIDLITGKRQTFNFGFISYEDSRTLKTRKIRFCDFLKKMMNHLHCIAVRAY